MRPTIITIIATSCHRSMSLLKQAIPSVLNQSCLPDILIVVDDNKDIDEYRKIDIELKKLQSKTLVDLKLIRNSRTHAY